MACVYAAWTDPGTLQRWLCPGDLTAPEVEADVRVGGRHRICMREPGGETHVVGGEYREIVRDQRLAFSWRWEGSDEETLVTVELVRDGAARTTLTLTHERFAQASVRDRHGEGWSSCLVELAQEVMQ